MNNSTKTVEQLELNQQKFVDQGVVAFVVLLFFVVLSLGVVFMNYRGFTIPNIVGVIGVSSLVVVGIVFWYEVVHFLKHGFGK